MTLRSSDWGNSGRLRWREKAWRVSMEVYGSCIGVEALEVEVLVLADCSGFRSEVRVVTDDSASEYCSVRAHGADCDVRN